MLDAPASAVPWFLAVSVTEKLPPTTALPGGLLTLVSTRSIPTGGVLTVRLTDLVTVFPFVVSVKLTVSL